jgi:hypothetical protein
MGSKPSSTEDEYYSEEEIERRRDAAVIRALNTPPKPHKPLKSVKRQPGDSFVYSVAALKSLPRTSKSDATSSIARDVLEVSVGPYLGPTLPALDNDCIGYLVRNRNGRTTFLALE